MTHHQSVHDGTPIDPGLTMLVMLLGINGVGADPQQIRHQFGSSTIGIPEMLRCAKALGLRARVIKTSWARLAKTPLPAIASLHNGSFMLVGKVSEQRSVEKIKDLFAGVKGDLAGRLAKQSVGEFHLATEGEAVAMKVDPSLVKTDQLPDDRIIELARGGAVRRSSPAGAR